MIQGYVAQQIRRTNRNLLITNIVLVAIILGIFALCSGYLKECFSGPFSVKIEDIAGLNSASDAPHTFITFSIPDNSLDRTYYHITGGSEKANDFYHFIHLPGGKYLIIRAFDKDIPDVLEGSITTWKDDVNTRVLPGIAADVDGNPLPLMIDLSAYRYGMYWMFIIMIPLLLLAIWNITKAVKRMGDPLKSPTAKQLATLGPIEEMAIAIDAEVREGGVKTAGVLTTRSWLIRPNAFKTDLLYLGDIAWAYKSETKHKTYGVTTSRTYATVIYDVRGRQFSFQLKQEQVDTLLRDLASRVPWAIIGYNAAIQAAWRKNRKDVLAQIEERKRQLSQSQPGANPPNSAAT